MRQIVEVGKKRFSGSGVVLFPFALAAFLGGEQADVLDRRVHELGQVGLEGSGRVVVLRRILEFRLGRCLPQYAIEFVL